jgi:hypothetical protein
MRLDLACEIGSLTTGHHLDRWVLIRLLNGGLSDILKQCAVFCFAFSFFTPHRNARFEIMCSSAGLLIDDSLTL